MSLQHNIDQRKNILDIDFLIDIFLIILNYIIIKLNYEDKPH